MPQTIRPTAERRRQRPIGRPRCDRRRERGAVLVEAALMLPLALLILFGIIEYGLAFKNAQTVLAATRNGARTAAAQPREADYHTSAAEAVRGALLNAFSGGQIQRLVIYKADPSTGDPTDATDPDDPWTCTANCYRFTWNQSLGTWVDTGATSWPGSSQAACGGVADTDYVGVWVQARHDYLTGLFGSSRTLRERTVMRLEPIPESVGCRP